MAVVDASIREALGVHPMLQVVVHGCLVSVL